MTHVHPAETLLKWEATLSASKFYQKVEAFAQANQGFNCMKFTDSREEFMPHYLVMSSHSDDRMFERNFGSSATAVMASVAALIKDTAVLESIKDSCLMVWNEDTNAAEQEGDYNAVALVREGMDYVPMIQVGEQHFYIRTFVKKSKNMFFKKGTKVIHFDANKKCIDD